MTRALVVAALVVAGAALALAPGPAGTAIGRLAGGEGDGPGPLWNVPVDEAALRRAAAILPRGASYHLRLPPAPGQLGHDVEGGARLFLPHGRPVRRAEDADWILVYGAEPLLPAGIAAGRVHRLGDRVALVEVARP